MKRSDLENGLNEREALTAEEAEVASLLGGLPRVEAPANFEFGVKARIATGNAQRQTSLMPFLKVAAPLSLVLLVIASVIFYGVVPSENVSPEVAEVAVPADNQVSPSEPPVAAEPQVRSESQVSASAIDVASPAVPVRRNVRPLRVNSSRSRNITSSPSGGSVERTYSNPEVIGPPGIPTGQGRNANTDAADIPVQEVLEMLGMKVEFVGGSCTVRSTAENGVAIRSGVQSKDVIEAINDQAVSGRTKLKNGFQGKSLTVRRGGKQIKLDLKN